MLQHASYSFIASVFGSISVFISCSNDQKAKSRRCSTVISLRKVRGSGSVQMMGIKLTVAVWRGDSIPYQLHVSLLIFPAGQPAYNDHSLNERYMQPVDGNHVDRHLILYLVSNMSHRSSFYFVLKEQSIAFPFLVWPVILGVGTAKILSWRDSIRLLLICWICNLIRSIDTKCMHTTHVMRLSLASEFWHCSMSLGGTK